MAETSNKVDEAKPEEVTTEASTTMSIQMPAGCLCGLKWRIPDESEGFTWNYLTSCPVDFEDHPSFRPLFKHMLDSGSGGGQAQGGARLVIDDGKVSCDCVTGDGVVYG
jgi:hypothetical protein